ncbi:a152.1 [Rat cytomegalovirus ALL-03]|uniref:A152.1 n=2 Tax=Rat cytomegalovirus (isolate England) TaxID=1261657 RepID=A0A0F6R6R2_RCMVE|nr:e152.1 [Murid betaherpesvirus 8]AFX83454.1 e152.1 [Murid betaherpesvirus 8]AKE44304.1 a152.1 [Rat cytomegalovirus ALL-03]
MVIDYLLYLNRVSLNMVCSIVLILLYLIKLDVFISSHICSPLVVAFECVFDEKYIKHTVSVNNSFPLLTMFNGHRKNIYTWVDISEMRTELEFLTLQESHIMDLHGKLSQPTAPLVFIYICTFFPLSCTFSAILGGITIISNNGSYKYYDDWLGSVNLSPYYNGFGLDIIRSRQNDVQNRWLRLCNILVERDVIKNHKFSFTYNSDKSLVRCRMHTAVPLTYSIVLDGPNLIRKTGVSVMTATSLSFFVSINVPSSYNVSLCVCRISSPTGWTKILTKPKRTDTIVRKVNTIMPSTISTTSHFTHNKYVSGRGNYGILISFLMLFLIIFILVIFTLRERICLPMADFFIHICERIRRIIILY